MPLCWPEKAGRSCSFSARLKQRTIALRNHLARFMSKLLLDVMPAALASVIGGFLFTQYHHAPQPAPQTEVVAQDRLEQAIQIIRDEHAIIAEFVRQQDAARESAEAVRLQELNAARMQAAQSRAAQARLTAIRATETKAAETRPVAAGTRGHEALEVAGSDARPRKAEAVVQTAPLPILPDVARSQAARATNPIAQIASNADAMASKVGDMIRDIKGWIISLPDRLIAEGTPSLPTGRLLSASW
jgi:hypothetical protein